MLLGWGGGGGGGVALPEKLGGSGGPYPIYELSLRFSLPRLRPDQKFDTLFMTVAAGTIAVGNLWRT